MAVETTVIDPKGQPIVTQDHNHISDAMKVMDAADPQGQPADGAPAPAGQPAGDPPANGQTPAPAPEGEPPPKAAAPDPAMAQRWAEIQRREASLSVQQKELLDLQKLQATKGDSVDDLKRMAIDDPLQALKHLGLSFEDVTRFALNNKEYAETNRQDELAKEQERINEQMKNLQDQRDLDATASAKLAQEGEIRSVLDKDDQYEISRFKGAEAIDFAIAVSKATEEQYGFVPKWSDVLAQVEAHYTTEVSALLRLNKVQSSVVPPGPQQTPTDAQPAQGGPPAAAAPAQTQTTNASSEAGRPEGGTEPQTLNNDQISNAAPRQPRVFKTDEDLRKEAIALMDQSGS